MMLWTDPSVAYKNTEKCCQKYEIKIIRRPCYSVLVSIATENEGLWPPEQNRRPWAPICGRRTALGHATERSAGRRWTTDGGRRTTDTDGGGTTDRRKRPNNNPKTEARPSAPTQGSDKEDATYTGAQGER